MSSTNICPFCDDTQAFRFISETPTMRIVYPRNPAIPYHLLITPKRHVKLLGDLEPSEAQELFLLLKQVTSKAETALEGTYLGYNLLSNNGSELINQRVPHTHLHVFIRTSDNMIDPLTSQHSAQAMEFTEAQLQDLSTIKSWFN